MWFILLLDRYASLTLAIYSHLEMSVVQLSPEPICRIDSDISLTKCIFGYPKCILHCSIVFRGARILMVSHQASNSINRMENFFLNLLCSFDVTPKISPPSSIGTSSVSHKLLVVASVSASDRWIWNCSHFSAVMCTSRLPSSSVAADLRTNCLANMLLGLVALVPTSCNCCRLWCWNNVSKILCLLGVAWLISHCNRSIAFWRSASEQVVAACQALFRCTWNCLRFIVETFSAHTLGPPVWSESYESFFCVTDGIPLPTGHPLSPSQTLTFSVLQKYTSSGKITSMHRLVVWGKDLSDFVGWQVERIRIIPGLLPSAFHRRLFLPQFSYHPCSTHELNHNSMPVFW